MNEEDKLPEYLLHSLDDFVDFKNDVSGTLITDIDGTISEIVPTPMEARVSPKIRKTMEKLSNKFKYTGVMTGRSVKNALEIMKSDQLIYIGNHGLEKYKNGKITIDNNVKEYIPLIKNVALKIQSELNHYKCILYQDKELSFTIHYRLCNNTDDIKKKALDIISKIKESTQLKIVEGRMIIEIRPPIGENKGTILQKFIIANNIKKIIYLGDDITDSDAFNKLNELKGHGITTYNIVVRSAETPEYVIKSADYYVNSVDEIHQFFKWLLDN